MSEATRFYNKAGAIVETVTAKNGKDRKVNIRDARKMDLVPSVTSILKLTYKFGLEYWKQEQLIKAALELEQEQNESQKDFFKRIRNVGNEIGLNAAVEGTKIHAAIQKSLEAGLYNPLFQQFYEFKKEKGIVRDISERAFATNQFAGTIDYVGLTTKNKKIYADFKTKDGVQDIKKAYSEHGMQLAAYIVGAGDTFEDVEAWSIYIDRNITKIDKEQYYEMKFIQWATDDLTLHLNKFKALLKYWRLENGFEY